MFRCFWIRSEHPPLRYPVRQMRKFLRISQPAASTDFQEDRPKKKLHQRKVPPATKAPGSGKQGIRLLDHPALAGWKWAVH